MALYSLIALMCAVKNLPPAADT